MVREKGHGLGAAWECMWATQKAEQMAVPKVPKKALSSDSALAQQLDVPSVQQLSGAPSGAPSVQASV